MRRRLFTWFLVPVVVFVPCPSVVAATAAGRTIAAAGGASCTFNGSALPLVTGLAAGTSVNINCTGLPPLHPYLLVEGSPLIGVDPKAAGLFSGGLSLSALLSALAAFPEINPGSFAFPFSDLFGDLNTTWRVPYSQPINPNASCPPSLPQFNSGLIGCALAMVDLTSLKPVAAGSAVLEFAGYAVFPPGPTLSLSPARTAQEHTVSVSDVAGATTYWWIATISALGGLLSGGSAPPVRVTVKVDSVLTKSDVVVTPASYNGFIFTPPKLSGSFVVPAGVAGLKKVTVTATGKLLAFSLSIFAIAKLYVQPPPAESAPRTGGTG